MNDKKEAVETLIAAAAKCEKQIKVSDLTKMIVTAFGFCEEHSYPYRKAIAAMTPELYSDMMAEFSSLFFANLLAQADPEKGTEAVIEAAKKGQVGITMPVKDGAKA